MKTLLTVAGVDVVEDTVDGRLQWRAGMMIDADGCPRAYHPEGHLGLDALSSAGYPKGGWRNILAVGKNGKPYVQKAYEQAPGFFVSMTTYRHGGFLKSNPRSWVDALTVPYVVVPPAVRLKPRGIVLGCQARISYKGKQVWAVVADVGPGRKIGEASIAAADALGIPSNPRTGGRESKDVLYEIWPGVPATVNGVGYQLQAA